jgi:hypothetical protein
MKLMGRDIEATHLYCDMRELFDVVRRPGTGQISDAAEVTVSTDGRWTVFAGTLFDKCEGAPPTRICMTDLGSGDTRVLSFGPNMDRLPKFSPDGRLAVGQASEFVVPLVRPLVSGIFTVPDESLFEDLYILERSEGIRIEPSAAAGLRGPRWLLESEYGRQYLSRHGLLKHVDTAIHVLWTTGRALVPKNEYGQFHERGRNQIGMKRRAFPTETD